MDNNSKLQIISAYIIKRNARLRSYYLQQQRRRRAIIQDWLKRIRGLAGFVNLPRELAIHSHGSSEVEIEVLEKLNGKQSTKGFRISRENFQYICDTLRPILEPKFNALSANHRKATVEEKVAICLYKLKSSGDYQEIANIFGFSRASILSFVHTVVRAIVSKLAPLHIKMPNATEAESISNEFLKIAGIPQVIGAISTLHIPITAPRDLVRYYFNGKGCNSIILQAVVDHNSRFIDISCKFPGSYHEALVLNGSQIYLRQNEIFPSSDYFIEDVNIPYLLLGIPAYPSLPWILKEYSGGDFDPIHQHFNLKLKKGRVKVDQAFGVLKNVFRILSSTSEINVNFMPLVVAACCTVYNIIQDDCDINWNESFQPETTNESEDIDSECSTENIVRELIATAIFQGSTFDNKIS